MNERVFYVYAYFNPLNDMKPFYIGRGKGDRILHHLRPASTGNLHKSRTIAMIRRETGEDPPFGVYEENLSFEESCRIEMELIAKHGRADLGTGPLTNLTDGGDGPSNISEETRRQMSKKKIGTVAVVSPEGRRFRVPCDDPRWLSGELVGQTKGLPCSEERKRRSSEVHKGRKRGDEEIRKCAESLRGRKQDKDHIAALSAARKGKVMVRPQAGGDYFKVSMDDPRLLSGELVGVTSGRIWVHDPVTKICKVVDAASVPDGFVKGRIL